MSDLLNLSVYLSDINATFNQDPLSINAEDESEKKDQVLPDQVFINGSDIYTFIYHNLTPCSQFMTFVIANLPSIYYQRRAYLTKARLQELETILYEPLVKFENIDDNHYRLIGRLNKFNTLRLTVDEFLQYVNDKQALLFEIAEINLRFQINYGDYIRWDTKSQQLLPLMVLNCTN